ncbi:hypothetical protein BH23BAC3_BH23BAC3_28810 [soil metagenome]
MSADQNNLDQEKLQKLLLKWLNDRLNEENYQKVNSAYTKLKKVAEDWEVFSSFSSVPRYTGKDPLALTDEELHEAERIRSGWHPSHWNIDQTGRTLLLLGIAERSKEEFFDKLEKLFISSDMGEAVALYQSLPILPYPEDLRDRAAEGIRSNITSVFNAVALRNPYPADYLDEDAWNQIVLKSLFMGSPLYLIQGIDRRSNENLAHMLVEYAHERWSAGREVSPELWRPVGPFIDQRYIDDIKHVLNHTDAIHSQAAVLALSDSESSEAKALLKEFDDIESAVHNQNITWNRIGEHFEKNNG